MNDIRCAKCAKKLAEGQIEQGELAIKCSRCGNINLFSFRQDYVKPLSAPKTVELATSQPQEAR